MLSFQLLNEINIAIRDMPPGANQPKFSTKAARQLEALDLLDDLLNGMSHTSQWMNRYHSFCGIKQAIGVSFSEEGLSDTLLLDELLESCEEDVLDALLIKYGETSALGSHIKEFAQRYHVGEQTLKKQIQHDLSSSDESFYSLLRETILQKYNRPSNYYNEIRFSRKLFSKIKNVDYVLSRENALWLIAGLAPDYWRFVRLFNAAGYSLRQGNRRDTIIKFVVKNGNYSLDTLNSMLDFFGETCIGTS